jgi:restriction system protein
VNSWRKNFEECQEEIDALNGHQFEKFLEHMFKDMGFVVSPTRQTGDQGADIILENFGVRTVVQAKCYSENVGNKAVQEVVGAKAHYQCQKAIVVTNQFFTPSAISLATSNTVGLYDRRKIIELLERFPQQVSELRRAS